MKRQRKTVVHTAVKIFIIVLEAAFIQHIAEPALDKRALTRKVYAVALSHKRYKTVEFTVGYFKHYGSPALLVFFACVFVDELLNVKNKLYAVVHFKYRLYEFFRVYTCKLRCL